ncbi:MULTISPECIES: hypothetical protein [Aeromonas]|uniref:hypothetical protein n=1 Tax=Aeromonas TaxID=642 RepID=UPI0022DF89FF|nr:MULTISPECIES: hypothetical protein [Aeromonas]WEA31662.1 hypothetical protein PWO56_07610 [Aeromonas hydrophila]WEA32178.1 hypothetical protein PWO56_10320 [Aeromonas hydrophila]
MKRFNCTLADKRGEFGECMEAHNTGRYVLFSDVEKLQRRMQEMLDKSNRTGVAIERAISTGAVPADHPLKSRLDLLANHHKHEQALADGMVAMADQCHLLASLLRELRDGVEGDWCFPGDLDERIDSALAVTLCVRLDAACTEAATTPTEQGYRELQGQHDKVQSRLKAALDIVRDLVELPYSTGGLIVRLEVRERARDLLAGQVPALVKGRTITEGQEFELTAVLQSIANGFSDDPAHDAAAMLKRIAGEVPWTGDSFQIPPRQGGEPCALESRSSSKA